MTTYILTRSFYINILREIERKYNYVSGEKIGIRVGVTGNAVGYQPKDPGSTPGCDFQFFQATCLYIGLHTIQTRKSHIRNRDIHWCLPTRLVISCL